MEVLLIDASAGAARTKIEFESEGFAVTLVDSGRRGLELAKDRTYRLVILDTELPDMSGRDIVNALWGEGVRLPILVLSDDPLKQTVVEMFRAGANDFVTRPYYKDELIERARSLVRSEYQPSRVVRVGCIEVDFSARITRVEGRVAHLPPNPQEAIERLALSGHAGISQQRLAVEMYGSDSEQSCISVRSVIHRLRKVLASKGAADHVVTTLHRGYALRAPAE